MANTPIRTFRISDDIYCKAINRAMKENVSVTSIVVKHLQEYGGANNETSRNSSDNSGRTNSRVSGSVSNKL